MLLSLLMSACRLVILCYVLCNCVPYKLTIFRVLTVRPFIRVSLCSVHYEYRFWPACEWLLKPLDVVFFNNSLSLIVSALPTNCRAYLQRLIDSKSLLSVIL